MTAPTLARLRITLDDVTPQTLRRIEVPLSIWLDQLHLALQAAMGWTNSHLYEIRAAHFRWGGPDPGSHDGPLDARKACLMDIVETNVETFGYLYDFGDGWEHTVRIESLVDAAPGAVYPRLIDAVGRCPPEDVGGPCAYAEFLEAIADPKHERHVELAQWIGDGFDPNVVDVQAYAAALETLAKKWSRKPLIKRPTIN